MVGLLAVQFNYNPTNGIRKLRVSCVLVVVSEELFLSCYGCGGRRKYWRLLLLLRHPPQKRQFDHLNWTTTQTCSSSSSRRAPPVTQAFAEEAFSPSAPPLHEDDCVIGLNPCFPAASCSFSYVVFCASCPSGYYLFFLFRSLTPWELPGSDFPTFLLFCFVVLSNFHFVCSHTPPGFEIWMMLTPVQFLELKAGWWWSHSRQKSVGPSQPMRVK